MRNRQHKGRDKQAQQQQPALMAQAQAQAQAQQDALRFRASLPPRPGQLSGQVNAGAGTGGMRERAALAQADYDARAFAGFGQAAPVTRPLRGEFTIEQVRWIALYLADNRPFRWVVIPHETRIGTQRYYAEIVHIDYDHTHIARIVHDRAEFWRFLMDAEANDAPIHLPRTATPLPAGHRR